MIIMMAEERKRFVPDYVVPPGATIREFLDELGMTQAELARRMDRPESTISQIINGKKRIEPETALQLERVLGMTAGFWARLEANYRVNLARQKQDDETAQVGGGS
jgi:addiction module HigA family antidote